MAIALVTNSLTVLGQNGGTSSSSTTTSANLIIVHVSQNMNASVALSDSKSNTWIQLTDADNNNANILGRIRTWYCFNPTVGTSHTFTSTGSNQYGTIVMSAFSGVDTTQVSFVETSQVANNVSTITNGSITAAASGSLFITSLTDLSTVTISIDSSFTISNQNTYPAGTSYGAAMAYKIKSGTGAEAPIWNLGFNTYAVTHMVLFGPASTDTPITSSDSITVSDDQQFALDMVLAFNDSVSLSHDLSYSLGFPFFTSDISDSITVTDDFNSVLGVPLISNAFTDAYALTDVINVSLAIVDACRFSRENVRNSVAEFFNNPAYYLDVDFNDSIQDGSDEIVAFTGSNYGTAVIPFTQYLTYYDFLTLVPDFVGVVAIYNNVTKRWLIPESMRKFDNIREDWECAIGTPEYFSPVNHRYVAIYRKPGVVSYGDMWILYRAACPVLTDFINIPVPLEYSVLVETYVQMDLWEQNQEWTKASRVFRDYSADLQKLHNLVHSRRMMDRAPGL